MADGVSSTVTIAPSDGPRHRGHAQGLGLGIPAFGHDTERAELLDARRSGEAGLVHSWELVTAVDGPGTRMTMFMSGCPLRCVYCHNPDTMGMKEGTIQTVDQIVKKVLRYRAVFKASGGGLTISGGEPLFQIAFTRRVLKAVHDAGIHTAIDTSGYLGARLSDDDLKNVDLVLLDVKSGDPDTYKVVSGGRELQPTITFGDRLAKSGTAMWVRFVLVPGYTDDPENVRKVAEIVSPWKNVVQRVEVLPFHNMGQDKWESLGMHYELKGVKPPSHESVEATRDIFRSYGFTVF